MNKNKIHIKRALPFESKCVPAPICNRRTDGVDHHAFSSNCLKASGNLPNPPIIPAVKIVKPD